MAQGERLRVHGSGRTTFVTVVFLQALRVALSAGSFFSVAGAAVPGFTLVEKGVSKCAIVIPAGAGEIDRRAASLLQDSVRKMTGAVLPIVEKSRPGRRGEIIIGLPPTAYPAAFRPQIARLKEDGFLAVVSNRNIYIVSGGHKGSIYAVIHLLEKYAGCRKFSPTAEFIPRSDSLFLGRVYDLDNPANEVRIVNGEFSLDEDYRDWMRLDTQDELFARGYYVHTFQKLLPWEIYFRDHPEYFALLNGKRIIDQPCPTRPEVFDIMAAALDKEMAAQPDRTLWSVSQNDNFSYCRCPECEKVMAEEGSPAGPILRLVNKIAARFPAKVISTLAYQYSRPAPLLTKPAANVQIMLCTIELNRSLPIDQDPGSRAFLDDITAWGKIAKRIYLWDYTVNFSHHVSPFPNLHVLQPNIRFFVGSGVRQHFQQTNTSPGHEFSELKGYLLARLLWNPNADFDALMNDFLGGYYGAAAPFIRRYIDALRGALAATGGKLDIYEPPVSHAEDYLSAENAAVYNMIFDLAETAAASDFAALGRVRTARLPLQYALIEIGKNDMFGPRGFYVRRGDRFEARPEMTRLLDGFFENCLSGGVRTLSESGLTPKDYYDAARRFLDVQIEGNLAFRKSVTAAPAPAAKYARGDLGVLTNGVHGANDFQVHWLGWEGLDFDLTLDLGEAVSPREISLATLYDPKSWILHPRRVVCSVSGDGTDFREIGATIVDGDQRRENVTRNFSWASSWAGIRYIRFHVEGTKTLPPWHPSAGGASWVFIDEIVVR